MISDELVLLAIPVLICLIVLVNGGGKDHIDAVSGPSVVPGVPMKAVAGCQVMVVMLLMLGLGFAGFVILVLLGEIG